MTYELDALHVEIPATGYRLFSESWMNEHHVVYPSVCYFKEVNILDLQVLYKYYLAAALVMELKLCLSVICVSCQSKNRQNPSANQQLAPSEKQPDANLTSLHHFVLAGSDTCEKTLAWCGKESQAWQSGDTQRMLPEACGIEI